MVEQTPHPPCSLPLLPIGSADSADAEREKLAPRLGKSAAEFCWAAFGF